MVKPEIAGSANFEIKNQFMRELRDETFLGNKNENAHEHVERILDFVSLFNIPGVTHDAVILRVFPITLTRSTKRWLEEIYNFKQEGDETLYQSWERDMKKLKENVHDIQVGCETCGGAHLNNECPLHEELAKDYRSKADNEMPKSSIGQCKAIFANDEALRDETISDGTNEIDGVSFISDDNKLVYKKMIKGHRKSYHAIYLRNN
ncbi:hypothetical protein Tco_1159594 [Tanacetum coccineum]